MLILITAASVACFMLVFWLANIVPVARSAIATAQGAMASVRAPDMDELEREKAVQSAAVKMLGFSASLILRSLLALAVAALPVLAADWLGLMPQADSLAFMARWDVIVIVSLIVIAGYMVVRKAWPG